MAFLKIDTGAGEQSNAGRSIADLSRDFSLIEFNRKQWLATGSALIHFPISLAVKANLQQPVLGIMALTAVRAG